MHKIYICGCSFIENTFSRLLKHSSKCSEPMIEESYWSKHKRVCYTLYMCTRWGITGAAHFRKRDFVYLLQESDKILPVFIFPREYSCEKSWIFGTACFSLPKNLHFCCVVKLIFSKFKICQIWQICQINCDGKVNCNLLILYDYVFKCMIFA